MFRRLFILVIMNLLFLISISNAQVFKDNNNGFFLELPENWKAVQPNSSLTVISSEDNQGRIIISLMPKYPIGRSQGESYLLLKDLNDMLIKKCSGAVVETLKKDKIADQRAEEAIFSYTDKNGNPTKMLSAYFWVNDSIYQVACVAKLEKFEGLMPNFMSVLNSLKLQSLTANDWAVKGYVFKNSKEYDKAIKAFTNATKLDAKNAEYPYQLAYTYSEKGNFNQAVVEITKAIELKPKDAFYYHERAYAYVQLKNAQLALADDNKAIQIDSQQAIYYAGRGNAYVMMGKYNEALTDFQKCLELKGDPLDSKFNLGQIYELLGNNEEALKYYKMILEYPSLPEPIKAKVQARANGDWDSYREWI